MNSWQLKVVYVKTTTDPVTHKPVSSWRHAPERLELPTLQLDDAKAAARKVLAARQLVVRGIAVEACDRPTLIAYVHDGSPVQVVPERGVVFKTPPKPVRA